ncbi:polysaccharide deacetylase family protein [Salirhabdus salicampi]|uniref:polysaccharide deacetylase family protein n=1 Tax=Salirhabdus salicampi TaxID=476102 RepID=UPI0020C27FD6|nr:polysaccharide deacetylase family protein [Salirhabdus salicampi]MCP8616475.1 polysaccharide deacetylase family protein [Salirhabdus salicampi]
MKRRYMYQTVLFLLLVTISFVTFENPYTKDYVTSIKNVPVQTANDDPLYNRIVENAANYEKEPKNAKIDKVWKKMPGLNGLEVDIKKSYKKMKQNGGFDEKLLVFKEIEPEVKFSDLPAAPVYRGHPEKEMVSFAVNVAWGEEHVPDMLKTLNDGDVKATFFIDGKWAQQNLDLVKMIKEEGHEIGNHGYNHPDFSRLSSQQIYEQVKRTNDILEGITGKKPKLFAPPAGSFNEEVVKVVDNFEMETILWTVDTVDWKKPSKRAMINRVMKKVDAGSIILMHPTEVTKKALQELILNIKQKEYKMSTVSQLLTEKR